MTRTTNARIAGSTFLIYIAAGVATMVLIHSPGSASVTEKLAYMAQHALPVRINLLLGLVQAFCAFVLGTTLYSITRDEDADIALIGLVCRVGEGLMAAFGIRRTIETLWLSQVTGLKAPDATGVQTLGVYLLNAPGANLGAIFFAVGSLMFSYLFLKARLIPTWMAWLGVAASVLLVVGLPLQLAGFLTGAIVNYMWIPMAAFEIPLGFWLIVKGVRAKEKLNRE
jgi:hypothetical protein